MQSGSEELRRRKSVVARGPCSSVIHRCFLSVQLFYNPGHGRSHRSVERKAAGTLVSAATEVLGYRGNVHFAFAAQADAPATVGQFAEEDGYLHVTDRQHI